MTFLCNKGYKTDVTCVHTVFFGKEIRARVTQTSAFCQCFVDHCPFVLFLLVVVSFIPLRLTVSDYRFGIFKQFCNRYKQDRVKLVQFRGGSRGGGTRRAPSKIEKNMISFWRKIVIFHTKYPKHFREYLKEKHLLLQISI